MALQGMITKLPTGSYRRSGVCGPMYLQRGHNNHSLFTVLTSGKRYRSDWCYSQKTDLSLFAGVLRQWKDECLLKLAHQCSKNVELFLKSVLSGRRKRLKC